MIRRTGGEKKSVATGTGDYQSENIGAAAGREKSMRALTTRDARDS